MRSSLEKKKKTEPKKYIYYRLDRWLYEYLGIQQEITSGNHPHLGSEQLERTHQL